MSLRDHALRHAAAGRRVFPLVPGAKTPLVKAFYEQATTDAAAIDRWFIDDVLGTERDCNIGISTDALLVLDVDVKNGVNGEHTITEIEARGIRLPLTYEQHTPTGGRHIVYSTPKPVRSSTRSLGPGLDVRGWHGYIVASGSVVAAGAYTDNGLPIAPAPEALIELCGVPEERARPAAPQRAVDESQALSRFLVYLDTAPRSIKGSGGDATAVAVARRGYDYGLDEAATLDAMLSGAWDYGCGWTPEKLRVKVRNAYTYARGGLGNKAPEAEFTPVPQIAAATASAPPPLADAPISDAEAELPASINADDHPVNRLNREHMFVLVGGSHSIAWETVDYAGRPKLELLDESTFHRMHTAETLMVGDKPQKVSKIWMDSPARVTPPGPNDRALWRRSYQGIVFDPSGTTRPGFYNRWRGFAFEPATDSDVFPAIATESLAMWKEHLTLNICDGNEEHSRWLAGWFAHCIQKPWEKPLTAVAMQGGKGVGKTTVAERFCALLGPHGIITQDQRYLQHNFNSHLEDALLMVLDEAVSTGDKRNDSMLKGLITGSEHLIERKGKEPYRVRNYTRVIVIGNEEWVVPASHDERRYAAFRVGTGRRQQNEWFERMREGMEQGGYRLLMRYLSEFDLTGIDVNRAPVTRGLQDQKEASLPAFAQWWRDSLLAGYLLQSDSAAGWPERVLVEEVRSAVNRYFSGRRILERVPDAARIGKRLREYCPTLRRDRYAGGGAYYYELPPLEQARDLWGLYLGCTVDWTAQP